MLPHITRRKHQVKAVEVARQVLRRGKIPCLSLPTGSGKTFVGIEIADLCLNLVGDSGGKVLIIANLSPLMSQWDESVLEFLGEERCIKTNFLWGKKRRSELVLESSQIIIAMAQTIESREWIPSNIKTVIWDEAHLSWFRLGCRKVIEKLAPDANNVLLTATPYRLDGQTFGDKVEIRQIATLRELIEDKTLVPFRAKNIPGFVIKEGKKQEGKDFTAAEIEQISKICTPEKVFDEWDKEISDGRGDNYRGDLKYSDLPTIGVCGSKESAKFYCEYFTSRGKPGVVITDDTSEEERKNAYERFREGKILLWSVVVLTIGFDEKCATVVLMLRATKSIGLLTQILGRVLRSMPGKLEGYFLDFTGTMVNLGRPDEIEDWTDVKQNPGKECPKCHYVCGSGSGECANCGYEFPKVIAEKKADDGIEIIGMEESPDDWEKDYREMEEIAYIDRRKTPPKDYYQQLLKRAYNSGRPPESAKREFTSYKKFSPEPSWNLHAVFGENVDINHAIKYLAYLRKVQSFSSKTEAWVWNMMKREFGNKLTEEWVSHLKKNVRFSFSASKRQRKSYAKG